MNADLETYQQLGLVVIDVKNKRNKIRLTDSGVEREIDRLIQQGKPAEAYQLALEHYGPEPKEKAS